MSRTRTLIAALGDANDIRSWSGTPFHELQEGRRQGVIDAGVPLSVTGLMWSARRAVWNLCRYLHSREHGGYQYSTEFLERLWAPVQKQVSGSRVINCFQLYPPSVIADASIECWFHIDQTLLQLFDEYGVRRVIGSQIAAEALERERVGYAGAAGVLTHSHWAAESVMRDYGIAPEKVAVVVPGANLDPTIHAHWADGRQPVAVSRDRPLRLVFVGKDPQRKGLDRLLRALVLARADGANCTLRVIGCNRDDLPPELRSIAGVEWVGFIDKSQNAIAYMNAVAACDVGCLLSRAEAGGIGLREYHALGLAVIGPDVGGSPDHVLPMASRLIAPAASDEDIAAAFMALDRNRQSVSEMRAISWARRRDVMWEASIETLAATLNQNRRNTAHTPPPGEYNDAVTQRTVT